MDQLSDCVQLRESNLMMVVGTIPRRHSYGYGKNGKSTGKSFKD